VLAERLRLSCTKSVLPVSAACSVFFIATPDHGYPQALHENRALVSKNERKREVRSPREASIPVLVAVSEETALENLAFPAKI